MPKALGSQAKEFVASLIHYFENERDNGCPLLPLTAVRERVAAALNLNMGTVTSVWQSVKKNEKLSSPKRKVSRCKPVTGVDNAVQVAIRNTIYQMYERQEHITLESIWEKVTEAKIFFGCQKSLHIVLRKIGFKWSKDNPRRGLMELPHVVQHRLTFLRRYHQFKDEQLYNFVFLDETWIFQNGTIARSWQDDNLKTVKSTKVDGKRYIVVHAGNRNGFIPDAKLVFSSATKNADYHGEMNQTLFLKWFCNLLLLLREPSVIIMDNAPYHNALVAKIPGSSSTKADIQEWLTANNVGYESTSLKKELLLKVALNKPPKQYLADQLAEEAGHKVLRLPPYHCNFNAIELVWGISKNYYNRHIGRNGKSVQACLDMWDEALNTVTSDQWNNSIVHVEKEIKNAWDREVSFDLRDIAPLIINLGNDSSDSSDLSERETEI